MLELKEDEVHTRELKRESVQVVLCRGRSLVKAKPAWRIASSRLTPIRPASRLAAEILQAATKSQNR
jgi:hypothetical protein